MKKLIITISREFGSGGRTIGKEIANRLSIPCYDESLIDEVTKESGYARDYVEQEGEYSPNKGFFSYAFIGRDDKGLSNDDYIWFAQRKVIEEISKESCVIVGRCADYILKDNSDAFHIFIYADKEFKMKRIVEVYGERTVHPEKRLADKDKRRILNYRYFTGREWGQIKNYDLSINSSRCGIEETVNLICQLVKGVENE